MLNGIESESLKEAFALFNGLFKRHTKTTDWSFLPIESMDKDKVLVMDYETKNHLELVSSQSSNAKAEVYGLLWISVKVQWDQEC